MRFMRWWLAAFICITLTFDLHAMNGASARTLCERESQDCVLKDYPAPAEPVETTPLEELFPEAQALCESVDGESVNAKVRRLQLKEARMRAQADRSWLFPTLDTEARATLSAEDRPDFPNLLYHDYYTTSATVMYPIYHWGGPTAIAHRGKEYLKQTKLQTLNDKRGQRDEILDLYFSLMIKTKRLAVSREELTALERQLKASGNSAPLSTVQQEENRLQQAGKELDVQQLENDVDSTRKRLELLTDGAEELKFSFSGFPSQLKIPELWTPDNMVKPPVVSDYESKARAQKDEEAIARAEIRPNFDLLGGFYQDQVDSVDARPVDRNNYYVAFRVHWQLFNGMRSSSNIAAAHARARINRELAQQAQVRSRNELQDNLRALKVVAQQYDIALARRKMALQQYATQEELNRQGQNSQENFEAARRARDLAEIVALENLSNFLKLYEKTQVCFDLAENSRKS